MTMRRVGLLCSTLILLASHGALAVSYPLPPEGGRSTGSALTIAVPENNTQPLRGLAAQHGQGLSSILEANLGINVYLPHSGSTLITPQQSILPDTVREGVVINVAEMHLYYYPPLGNGAEMLPTGTSQAGCEALCNWVTAVECKQEGLTWVPTANTRREYAKEGKILPALVSPGPDSPMGLYAIYIGGLYVIRSTDTNFGVELCVGQGCIRLRNDDIKLLFGSVPVGACVQLIDQPVKYTMEPDGSHWLKVHEPLSRDQAKFESDRRTLLPAISTPHELTQGPGVSPSQTEQTLQHRSGMPVNISAATVQGSLQRGA